MAAITTPDAGAWAVIVAAGGGARMAAERPKQYLPLRGRSLIEWSLAPFLDAAWIQGVVVVLARGDTEFARLAVSREPRITNAHGGAARADSVMSGLDAVAQRTRGHSPVFVLVHDAARPCLEATDLERLRESAADEHGGLLAIPVSDTLKRASDDRVASTVDRAALWRAQTPQMFRLDLLMHELHDCAQRGLHVTDEATAMERAGYRPRLVRGRDSNLKVTYPEDLALAEFWLAQRAARP